MIHKTPPIITSITRSYTHRVTLTLLLLPTFLITSTVAVPIHWDYWVFGFVALIATLFWLATEKFYYLLERVKPSRNKTRSECGLYLITLCQWGYFCAAALSALSAWLPAPFTVLVIGFSLVLGSMVYCTVTQTPKGYWQPCSIGVTSIMALTLISTFNA